MGIDVCRGWVDSCNCRRRYRATWSELIVVGAFNIEGSRRHRTRPCNGLQVNSWCFSTSVLHNPLLEHWYTNVKIKRSQASNVKFLESDHCWTFRFSSTQLHFFAYNLQYVIKDSLIDYNFSNNNESGLIFFWLGISCSAHGFGSAAVASGDADIMPFCLVTYILMGAVSSLAVSIPVIRTSLLQL